MTGSVGGELAAHAAEQHQLGDVVKVPEAADFGRVRSDGHALGNDRCADRKLDRLTDWAQDHLTRA